jgi:sortase A
MIAAALTAAIMLAGAASWQLWLSDVWARVEQERLDRELAAEEENPALVLPAGMTLAGLASAPVTTEAPVAAPTLPAVPVPQAGEGIGRLVSERAGLDASFVAGTATEDLKKGPGWMIGTAMPGSPGNAVISCHRTTYGGPFRRIDRLQAGDTITVSVPGFGDSVYEVRASFVVKPTDVWVAAATSGARLTLTTCHPEGSARERLIVQAELVTGPAAAYAAPPEQWAPSAPA